MIKHKLPEPKSLLESQAPAGFDEHGRRVIAECPEFRMVELWGLDGGYIIETSAAIEIALQKSKFNISDRSKDTGTTEPEERIAWAESLVSLARFTRSCKDIAASGFGSAGPITYIGGIGGNALAARLAHTIGRQLMAFENSPDIEIAISDCAAAFKNALRAYAVHMGRIDDKRRSSRSIYSFQFSLIMEAEFLFMVTRKRPNKETLRKIIEGSEPVFSGKDQSGKWADAFAKAGLGDLPNSP